MLTPARRATRAGSTLVELLVVLVVGAVLAGAIARSRATSLGGGEAAVAGAEARRQRRAAVASVEATLRGASLPGGDLLSVADTALELRVPLGASVVCASAASPPSISLLAPADDRVQAAWHDAPAAGDVLLVLGRPAPDSAWRWRALRVTDAPAPERRDCGARAGAAALRVPVDAAPPDEWAAPGTPARLLRRARWSAYRSDGRWFLGFRDARADGGLDVVQPVSGPHDRREAGAWRPAVRFALDGALAEVAVGSTVGTAGRVDSGAARVALRNARP